VVDVIGHGLQRDAFRLRRRLPLVHPGASIHASNARR
jgi:hypothetical protein